ncbi:MAG: hypothetical protein LCH30_09625 [Proteobacteria bacterium]|nr:hypothetical protein [Pseudomonadota bacterium]
MTNKKPVIPAKAGIHGWFSNIFNKENPSISKSFLNKLGKQEGMDARLCGHDNKEG